MCIRDSLSKRQAVVFKAPCAYIGPPAIYIGLEPILEEKKSIFFCWTAQQKNMDFFLKNWLQTYIDGWETDIGTWSFENQCLKWHRELQGSHRRANGAKIHIFSENNDFRRCSFSGFFFLKSKVAHRCEIPEFRSTKRIIKNRWIFDFL